MFSTQDVIVALTVGLTVGTVMGATGWSLISGRGMRRRLERTRARLVAANRRGWWMAGVKTW